MEIDSESPIREQLSPGEHLLWSGQPAPGIRLAGGDVFMIPFSLVWGGFAIVWEAMAIRSAPMFFWLWGIPFVLVGLYMIVGRFFFDAYRRANTFYGISNQRIVIVTRGMASNVKSLNLRTLSDVTLSTSSAGRGSIHFGSNAWGAASWFGASGWPGAQAAPRFELIDEARRVYEIVRQAQQKAA